MNISKYLKGLIWGFQKDERGSIAVEAVIILPMMFWTYLAIFATFHSYRTYAINQKAAYTLSDMISRETTPIDSAYLNGSLALFTQMVNADDNDTAVRVTIVSYDAENDKYEKDWSQTRGFLTSVPGSAEVNSWSLRLPVMPDGERIIVLETFHKYDPPFDTGLVNREITNYVFTKPRYAPQVLYDTGV